MQLDIEILSGQRKGTTLHVLPYSGEKLEQICEDESVKISICSDKLYQNVYLGLHDIELEFVSCEKIGNMWKYTWEPQRTNGYYHAFFINYFGVFELYIKAISDDYENLSEYQIEVLAKKMTASSVDAMLSYIAQHDSNLIHTFFRVSKFGAGSKEGTVPPHILIDKLENLVLSLSNFIDRIIDNPLTKLTPVESVLESYHSPFVDDNTINWLCNNIDELYQSDGIDYLFSLDGINYLTNKISSSVITINTDIYENQIIHGFIDALIYRLSELISGLNFAGNTANISNKNLNNNYSSFFDIIGKFKTKIYEKRIEKCYSLINKLNHVKKRLKHYIPVKKSVIESPIFTQKVKYNLSYLALYKKIAEWYRLGGIDWDASIALYSIENIPKLFEYYLFFLIKKIVEVKINCSTNIIKSKGLIFTCLKDDIQFALEYEPVYWSVEHKNSINNEIINSEKWKINNRGAISIRSRNSDYSCRSPDIVLSVFNQTGKAVRFIIDAKYSRKELVFKDYLPKLTLKYLHGIHDKKSGKSANIGLMIIHPEHQDIVRFFHHDNYNIFSNKPILPSIISYGIQPKVSHPLNFDLEKVINRIIELMLEDISKT